MPRQVSKQRTKGQDFDNVALEPVTDLDRFIIRIYSRSILSILLLGSFKEAQFRSSPCIGGKY